MSISADELITKSKEHITKARDIAATAGDRDFTDDERTRLQWHLDQSKQYRERHEATKADDKTKAAIRELGEALGTGDGSPVFRRPGEKTAAEPRGPRAGWTKAVMDKLDQVNGQHGQKALVTGSIDVPALLSEEVIERAQYPRRVVDLLVNRVMLGMTNTFSYVRQTVRTNNAAPVVDGATKPISVFTVAEIEDRVRVIAHLSEPTPERFFADSSGLLRFLESEMMYGLLSAIETQIVSGTGVGENMTGILNTSGIVLQPFATDVPTTLRKARTALEISGEIPTGFVMHPADVETIDLARAGAAGPWLMSEPTRGPVFGDLPIVPSIAVPAGTALLGDWNLVELVVREDMAMDADRSGTLFQTNQVQWRLEGRYGLAVLRPGAFARVTLTV